MLRCVGGLLRSVVIARPDQPNTWDLYVTGANLTITTDGTTGVLSPWDATSPVVGQAVRVPPPAAPKDGYPNLAGGWNSTNGWLMTCVQRCVTLPLRVFIQGCARAKLAFSQREGWTSIQKGARYATIDIQLCVGVAYRAHACVS